MTRTIPEASGDVPSGAAAVHASERVGDWLGRWRETGRIILLLDFDGTLAPIVQRPELAAIHPAADTAIRRLLGTEGVEVALVSGRGSKDVRSRADFDGIVYAGNHGMEIEGPGLRQVHEGAAAARPLLDEIAATIRPQLEAIRGAILEDKHLTLSIHYRQVAEDEAPRVREVVHAAAERYPGLRVTEGKMVLEVRPRVEWDKGRAVAFLLDRLQPGDGVPVIYIGDDTTDEDAFRALRERDGRGEGVLVAGAIPPETAAHSYLRSPDEVAELLNTLAERAPPRAAANK